MNNREFRYYVNQTGISPSCNSESRYLQYTVIPTEMGSGSKRDSRSRNQRWDRNSNSKRVEVWKNDPDMLEAQGLEQWKKDIQKPLETIGVAVQPLVEVSSSTARTVLEAMVEVQESAA